MWKLNSIIIQFYYTFFKQSANAGTSLWVCKSWKTLHRQEAWKQGKLWTQHDNCILYWTDELLTISLEMKTKKNVVPFNLFNKILCPEKNSISLTEVFHQAELKWNGLPESTLTYHSNSLWKASSGNCSYWNLWQAGGNCSDWNMWQAGGNCSNWNM